MGIAKEIEIPDYLFPPSNFSPFPFFFLIKKEYLCAVILGNVDL